MRAGRDQQPEIPPCRQRLTPAGNYSMFESAAINAMKFFELAGRVHSGRSRQARPQGSIPESLRFSPRDFPAEACLVELRPQFRTVGDRRRQQLGLAKLF
jgi:hypothetical protein